MRVDFTLGILDVPLKYIEFLHKIWDSAFKSRIHGSTESPEIRSSIYFDDVWPDTHIWERGNDCGRVDRYMYYVRYNLMYNGT